MGMPHVLVIDDSEAILAFTRSVLAPSYSVSVAKDGREGLELCTRLRPDIVLLDLSMPQMDGETVLSRMTADRDLAAIPVIIISSEQARAEACLSRGAIAYLVKPVRSTELQAIVGRSLEAVRARAARGSLAILPLGVGSLEFAIPLADVRHVLMNIATRPLPGGPSYLSSFFELRGESICVLDLAIRLGIEHDQPLVDRKLIVAERAEVRLALCADRVRDPEEILPADVQSIASASGADAARAGIAVAGALYAVAKTSRGPIPVLNPHALLSRGLVASLSDLVSKADSA